MTWTLPDVELPAAQPVSFDVKDLSARLTRSLSDLGAPSRVHRVHVGPSTIKFELVPGEDVRMRDYARLGRPADLKFALGTEVIRIEAPIPGERLVGLEIASPQRRRVMLSEVVDHVDAPVGAALGLEPDGTVCTLDIASLPHLLVAGASGSGKSTLLHAMLSGLLMRSTPDELALVLVDCKRIELNRYSGLPHLLGEPIYETRAAVDALDWLVGEVDARYKVFAKYGCESLEDYNRVGPETIPRVLCVVDELGDLVMRSKDRVEAAVVRLGQLGRACGVHLMLATQTPHATIVSGTIKANLLGRICLRVVSGTHSRVAIDQSGAQELLGHGDALLQDGQSIALRRFQSAYVERSTTDEIVAAWKAQGPVQAVAA